MIRKLAVVFMVFGFMVLGTNSVRANSILISGVYKQSIRGTVNGFPVVFLKGSPFEMGKAYGMLAGPEIVSSVNTMVSFVRSAGMDWNNLKNNLGVLNYNQRYLDELDGMMEGLEQSLSPSARTISGLGSVLTKKDLQAFHSPDIFQSMRCTQFSAWGSRTAGGEVIIGRNMDYPPLFNTNNAVVVAMNPDLPNALSTMDSVYFGQMVSGIMAINEQGVYLAGNAGNSGDAFPPQPYPGMQTLRDAIEVARPQSAVEDISSVIRNKIGISSIYHVALPVSAASGKTPMVIEYAPSTSGSTINTRGPSSLSDALIMSNHFGTNGSGGSQTRYQSLASGLQNYKNSGTKIGVEQAKALMAAVAQTGSGATRYSGIIWPKDRRIMVAKSSGSVPATSNNYVEVRWADIFPVGERLVGDSDLNGKIDGGDYITWLNHYDAKFAANDENSYKFGDYNNDKTVNGADYLYWLNSKFSNES